MDTYKIAVSVGNFIHSYYLGIELWIIGWLYACGNHYACIDTIRKNGTPEQKIKYNSMGTVHYVILFFLWPHYLGVIYSD